MLNRRILRIKAFKVLYAYAENPQMTLKEAEAQLESSCKATRDLYLFMLAVISPLTAEARSRIEAGLSKFNPTEEEKHPNMKFADNALAKLFDEDIDFQKIISKSHLSWDQYDVCLHHLYDSVRSKEYFAKYMSSGESSLREDVKLFVHIFEEEFVDNPDLEGILEDLSIYWIDDLAYALTYCCRTIEELARGARWSLPPLYQSELKHRDGQDSDKDFVTTLLRSAYSGFAKYSALVAGAVPKWDKERLFTIDMVLIICGLAEAASFPAIPVKVTINEYVEITKFYSTPKSRSFVNGLLDSLIEGLIADGSVVKTGKGLL